MADGLMLRRELVDLMSGGLWIVLAMVFVMIGDVCGVHGSDVYRQPCVGHPLGDREGS